jgi:hypothetical protein
MGAGSRGASLVAPSPRLVGWACADGFLQHKESQAMSGEVELLLVPKAIEFLEPCSTSEEARFPALDVETAKFGLGCIAWAVPGWAVSRVFESAAGRHSQSTTACGLYSAWTAAGNIAPVI